MAHFVFTSDGYFVNIDQITAMKIKGMIGKLEAIEIWFAGSTTHEPGLSLRFDAANELFEEMLRMHKMIGWTASDPEDSTKTEPTGDKA
jgi:hypothetical protein